MKLALFLTALAIVESGDNPLAMNRKEQAHGVLQIRPCVLVDVNRICDKAGRLKHYTIADCYDRQKAREIFFIYTNYWMKVKGVPQGMGMTEARARFWNGGPNGPTKEATARYWAKIQGETK